MPFHIFQLLAEAADAWPPSTGSLRATTGSIASAVLRLAYLCQLTSCCQAVVMLLDCGDDVVELGWCQRRNPLHAEAVSHHQLLTASAAVGRGSCNHQQLTRKKQQLLLSQTWLTSPSAEKLLPGCGDAAVK